MRRLPASPDESPSLTIGLLVLTLAVPGSHSLKDKRSVLLPLFSRIRRAFNVSLIEVGDRDARDTAIIAVVGVNSDKAECNTTLLAIEHEVENADDVVLDGFSVQFL
ncbi:MAG TPA: DUF503 domain-containing protein [Clostridia bacterium]|nr:DUF503 domain-containing protein [Clostridia bacterium]